MRSVDIDNALKSNLTFIPISPLTISSLFPVGVDVYSGQTGAKEILFLAADQIATDDALDWISSSPNLKLYISQNESATYQQYLQNHFDEWFEDDSYQHHERLDGKGYPVGIGGCEIDIASRICTVADVFDALTSNRSYRRSLSHSQSLEIMSEGINKSFDKEVFHCWSNIVHERMSS